jgi:CRISPR-associated protein Csx16
LLRKLQRYTVTVHRRDAARWAAAGDLEEWQPGCYLQVSDVAYSEQLGWCWGTTMVPCRCCICNAPARPPFMPPPRAGWVKRVEDAVRRRSGLQPATTSSALAGDPVPPPAETRSRRLTRLGGSSHLTHRIYLIPHSGQRPNRPGHFSAWMAAISTYRLRKVTSLSVLTGKPVNGIVRSVANRYRKSQNMTVYFITRHPGAVTWAREEGVEVTQLIDHLEVECIQPGDTVVGTLPVNLAARVCAQGRRYLHLSLELPPNGAGGNCSAEDMRRFGARVEEFEIWLKTQ